MYYLSGHRPAVHLQDRKSVKYRCRHGRQVVGCVVRHSAQLPPPRSSVSVGHPSGRRSRPLRPPTAKQLASGRSCGPCLHVTIPPPTLALKTSSPHRWLLRAKYPQRAHITPTIPSQLFLNCYPTL